MNDDARFQDLTRRLAEAEQTLRAIFSGQADAVVYPVSGTPLLLHQAQEALLESESRYRGLVTRMSALVFEATPDGTLVFVNEALTPISGYRPEEVLGQNWRNLITLPDQLGAALELLPHLRAGDVTGYEVTLRAKDGSPVTLELSSANRYAADGTLQRIVGLGMDRTRRKRAEQQRDQALHDLGERVKELTVLQRASRLLQDHARPMAELLQELVELLPPAYQYPAITSARIVLDDQEFATPKHAPSPWMLWANLGQRGIIEVCCLEERPVQAEGPFLAEERALLNTLAEMLGAYLERRQAEEERTASEIRFRTLTETTSAAIFIVEGLRILYANDAAQGITGYSCDELLDMELWQFAHPTYQDLIRQNGLKHPWGEDIPNRFELRVLTKGGEDRWWDVTTGSLEYEGKPAFVVTAFDITERDRAEKALRKAKEELEARVAERTAELRETAEQLQSANAELRVQAEELEVAGEELAAQNDELRASQQTLESERRRYQELFDFAPGGYLVTDLKGTIREANRAAAGMFGVGADWLVSKPLTVYVDEQDHSALYARLAELQKTQTAQTWEMRLAPRRGESFPALVDVAPARDAQGRDVGLRWLLRDITERRRAEEEIASLAKFPGENPNPILRLSRDGLILYANEVSAPLLREWGCATGERAPAYWRDLAIQALASRSNPTVDVECSKRIYSFAVAPIVERGYVNLYGRDITERKRAEEALRSAKLEVETEKRHLEAILQALPVGVIITDTQGGVLLTNRMDEQIWGSRPITRNVDDYAQYQAWWADSGKPVEPHEWASAQAVQKGESVLGQVLEIQRFDGRRGYIHNSAVPIRDGEGRIVGSAVAVQDITELRRTEQALRESELKYSAIFDNSPFAVSLTKMPDGALAGVNDAFLKLFEYTREEVIGKTSVDLGIVDPESRAQIVAELRERGSVQDFEAIRTTKSGARRILSLNLDWVSIGGEKHILTTIRDITARKRAEEALRESEQRFRLVLKNAPVSVTAQDRDLRFLWAYNQRTVDLGAVVGKTDTDLFPPEDAARLIALKRKVLEAETEVREQLWLTSGGQRVFLDLYLEPMRDAAGRVAGIGIATVDQTPMKLVEEELRVANEELTRFNNAMVGRELRMIELKQEVNELCGRAGLPRRYALDVQQEGP